MSAKLASSGEPTFSVGSKGRDFSLLMTAGISSYSVIEQPI
jgi:hypothetical protein